MIFSIEFVDFNLCTRKLYLDKEQQGLVITLGAGSYIVGAALNLGNFDGHVLVGKYSSIAHQVTLLLGLNHDSHMATTYPFRDMREMNNTNHYVEANHYQIIIGNDVWIGFGVTILGGVRIGNGAVIGAGAVIAKDVPPYAVVVGNPARVIRYRFPEDVIHKLQKIKWWNWSDEKIKSSFPLLENVEQLVDGCYDSSMENRVTTDLADELQKLRDEKWCIGYFVLDFASEMPVWERVVQQYLQKYTADDAVALLLELQDAEHFPVELRRLQSLMAQAGEQAPLLFTHQGESFPALDVMQNIDFMISSREEESSQCVDFADEYNIKVVSGLDFDIFADI